jgi:hypothetical protein
MKAVRLALTAAPLLPLSTARLAQAAFSWSFQIARSCPLRRLTNWMRLGAATELSPGQFQFRDAQVTNSHQRFYRVTSP